jgi:crossover junction endodeoxyribonuclease RuvC
VIVLGIDPGTAVTGYGVVTDGGRGQHTLVECGVIRTRARDPLPSRLSEIFDGVSELAARHHPDAIAVEDIFYGKNVKSTVSLGHARGVILLAGQRASLEIFEYSPSAIKKAIAGTGSATKEQIQFMIGKLLRLKVPPAPADASDGVAAALTCLMTARVSTMLGRRVPERPIVVTLAADAALAASRFRPSR